MHGFCGLQFGGVSVSDGLNRFRDSGFHEPKPACMVSRFRSHEAPGLHIKFLKALGFAVGFHGGALSHCRNYRRGAGGGGGALMPRNRVSYPPPPYPP